MYLNANSIGQSKLKFRSEVLQDPFDKFRDGAPSRVIFDHSANNSSSNKQILRQVSFIIVSISLQ